jgi:hypothetical protein
MGVQMRWLRNGQRWSTCGAASAEASALDDLSQITNVVSVRESSWTLRPCGISVAQRNLLRWLACVNDGVIIKSQRQRLSAGYM